MLNHKVRNLINKGLYQDCLEDALIFLEDAYKLHKDQTGETIQVSTINLQILSPSNLLVKELKQETKGI